MKKFNYILIKDGERVEGGCTKWWVAGVIGCDPATVYLHATNEKPIEKDGHVYDVLIGGDYETQNEEIARKWDEAVLIAKNSGRDLSKIKLVCKSGVDYGM